MPSPRTLAVKPKILLMDEPLTSLNPELKQQLMSDVRRIFDVLDATVIYVTHDQEEAGLLVDRVVTLENGRLRGYPPSRISRSIIAVMLPH